MAEIEVMESKGIKDKEGTEEEVEILKTKRTSLKLGFDRTAVSH